VCIIRIGWVVEFFNEIRREKPPTELPAIQRKVQKYVLFENVSVKNSVTELRASKSLTKAYTYGNKANGIYGGIKSLQTGAQHIYIVAWLQYVMDSRCAFWSKFQELF